MSGEQTAAWVRSPHNQHNEQHDDDDRIPMSETPWSNSYVRAAFRMH